MARKARHAIGFIRAIGTAAAGGALFLTSLGVTAAVTVAREVVTPPRRRREPIAVLSVEPDPDDSTRGLITLRRRIETDAAGQYSLVYDGGAGRAHLGDVCERTGTPRHGTVVRRYFGVRGTPLTRVRTVRVASSPQLDVSDLDLPWTEVEIPGELGPTPAWWLPAPGGEHDRVALHIHGRGATLTEPLRTVPLLAERGWSSLVIRYRNDPSAPAAPDRRYGLGQTEWRDADAALEWLRSRGARDVLLVGWSMGGAIALQTYLRSPFAHLVRGILLESAAVSWRDTLIFQARRMGLPKPVTRLGIALLGSPLARPLLGVQSPIDLGALEIREQARRLRVPVLLLHSAQDTEVPVDSARALVATRPDRIRYEEFTGARHTRLWNADRERWERVVGEWLDGFDRPDDVTAARDSGSAQANRAE